MSQLTKRALENSLKHLLQQKPLSKITITDIASDCGINRMTFYYHFKDIYDLVEWACVEDADRMIKDKKTYETWDQGFLRLFQGLLENKLFFTNVYHCVSREQVESFLYPVTYQYLMDVVHEKSSGMCVRQEDQEFIANFYKYGFVGLILDWVKNGMKEDPTLIIERLKILISGDIEKALLHYRTDL